MPHWLITGATGFLGRHLVAELTRARPAGVELVAIGRHPPPSFTGRFETADLDDPERLASVVAATQPSMVFHLAGLTPPASAERLYQTNVLGTVRLLDTLRACRRPTRVVLAGSAAELGPVPVESLPVGEEHPCQPETAYGLSKWLATCAGLAARAPLEVVIARVFNPIGPGLPASQALGQFASDLAQGDGPTRLVVGNLDARRDFIDVRDVAKAILALAERGGAGRVYHVGTGRSERVGDGLDKLIAWSGRSVEVVVDASRLGSSGPVDSRADVRRIRDEVGWTAEIGWERSLRDLWLAARSGLTEADPSV
jgi:GDP-4-dehydro-6-deoxy-D-mannose reductase